MSMDPAMLLRKSARIYPDQTALVHEGRRLTYAELFDRSARLANALRDAGIEPGDRVALLIDNDFEGLELITGLALGGYVRCPLYTHDTPDRQRYLLDLVGARALVIGAAHHAALAPLLEQAPELEVVFVTGDAPAGTTAYDDALAAASPVAPTVRLGQDDPHVIRFSAGTTGKSKGILHTVRGWMAVGSEPALAYGGYDERDRFLAAGPLSHGTGMIVWALVAVGTTIVVMPKFDPGRFLELVESEGVTISFLVPTMIDMVVRHPDAQARDLSSLRMMLYGAAPISQATLARAVDVWGPILRQAYGQSEAPVLTTLEPRHHVFDGTDAERARLRSAGRPLPNTMIRIVGEDGAELAPGEVGEIEALTPLMMREIWGDPEATAQRISPDGWLRTRDMGYLSEDGFLYLSDRKEDLIISGGFNIWPAELEDALAAHPAVAAAAVVGVSHEKWGETPHAMVVLEDGAEVSEQELIEWTRERVGSVKKVTAVAFADELPVTPIGKVLRRVVRERLAAAPARRS